jgi:hypothetical protein
MPTMRKPAGQTRCEQGKGTKDYPLPLDSDDAALGLAAMLAQSEDADLRLIAVIAYGAFKTEGTVPPDVRRDLTRCLELKLARELILADFWVKRATGLDLLDDHERRFVQMAKVVLAEKPDRPTEIAGIAPRWSPTDECKLYALCAAVRQRIEHR